MMMMMMMDWIIVFLCGHVPFQGDLGSKVIAKAHLRPHCCPNHMIEALTAKPEH
jgi:hypothetical protein